MNEEALEQIIDNYSAYVVTIISNIGGEALRTEDIEEIASDVFVAVWNHRDNIDSGISIKPYVAQIARNMTRSYFRKQKGENISLDDDILVVSKEEVDEVAIRREQREIINKAVSEMDQPDKEIFIRFYYFGEKIKNIASQLDLNLSTAKTKLKRSREKLKSIFEERGYLNEN